MKGELPEGWAKTPLPEIATREKFAIVDGPFGSDLKLSDYLDDGTVPVLTTRNLNGIYDPKAVRFISQHKFEQLKRSSVIPGDILIAKIGSIGKSSIYPGNAPTAIIPANLCKITVDHQLAYNRYIYWQIVSREFQDKLREITSATAQPAFSVKRLKTLSVKLAPLAEQDRIVERLEKVLTEIERCKERMAKIPVLLNRFRQSILASACSGHLTADWRETHCADREDSGNGDELPPGWNPVVVGDVIDDLRYGTSAKCSPQPNGSAVLRIPNIGSGIIDHSELKYARLPEAERKKLALVPGDVLMIRSNGSVSLVGKTAVVGDCEKGFAYAGYLIRLRVKPKAILPLFLHYCFASSDMRQQIEIPARSTSGVNNINSEEVRQLHLLLPPVEEQREIVQRAAKLLALADRIEDRYQGAKKQVDSLTQSILAKAFRGELVPTEADLAAREGRDYESAARLLERIRVTSTKPNTVSESGRHRRSKQQLRK